jgi:hypothetical protein
MTRDISGCNWRYKKSHKGERMSFVDKRGKRADEESTLFIPSSLTRGWERLTLAKTVNKKGERDRASPIYRIHGK